MNEPKPANESERLQALRELELLDTPIEPCFERFTSMAARIFQVPVAMVSLVDEERVWFKSCHGLPVQEMPREISFCTRAILDEGVLVVPDLAEDLRFSDNPLVINEPRIRFYAAAPLSVEGGYRIGTLAVMDRRPHHDFRSPQIELLRDLAGLVTDAIRQRKRPAEKTVKHPTPERISVADSLPDAIAVIDARERVVSWNQPACRTFGLDREQMLGRNLLEAIVPARYCAELHDAIGDHLQTGHSRLAGRKLTIPGLRANGEEFPAEFCITAAPGGRQGFVVQVRDISGQTRENEEQQKFISLVENSYDFVSMADFDGRIFYLNRAGRRLVGAPDGELNEYHSLQIFPEEQRRLYGSVVLPAILSTGSWQGEMQLINALSGERVDVDATVFHLSNRTTGAPLCVATTARDITQQKRAAIELRRAKNAAEEAARVKSMFLANMSHEIRTPMNAVIGMTSLLMDTPLNEQQKEYAGIIRNSGEALLSLIGRVLDFSKVDAGDLELESEPFELHECIDGIINMLAPRALDKGLKLYFVPDAEVPVRLRGDEGRLRQILANLLSNAIKFTEAGEVSLQVELEEPGEEQCLLHFIVRDTGIGIEPDRFEKIFEAFTQVDDSHARRFGGAGLGLTISRRLAELMGGRMWVGSKPGKGSSFHFTLRLGVQEGRGMAAAPAALAGHSLLLVTRSATLRDCMERYAQMWQMKLQVLPELPEASATVDSELIAIDCATGHNAALRQKILWSYGDGSREFLLLQPLPKEVGGKEAAPRWIHFLGQPLRPAALLESLTGIFTAPPEEKAQPAAEVLPAELRPLRILLAEDNIVNQKMGELMLGQLGYRVDTAEDGQEAIEAMNRQHYDVIFMDMQMPRVDGVAAARHIRSYLPKSQQPWIIAMTANASEEARKECLAAGMNDFVSKPVRTQDLRSALQRMPQEWNATPTPSMAQRLQSSPALYALYIESAQSVLSELQSCAGTANLAGLRSQAHKLKGSSLVLGIGDVAQLCSELETKSMEPQQIHRHLGMLAQAIERATLEYAPSLKQN
jgi:PAS domain S-box-containing protein